MFSRPWSDFFPDSVRPKEEMIATIKTIATESQGEREDEHTESIGTDA